MIRLFANAVEMKEAGEFPVTLDTILLTRLAADGLAQFEIVERMPKGKIRLNPLIVPTFAAWLTTIACSMDAKSWPALRKGIKDVLGISADQVPLASIAATVVGQLCSQLSVLQRFAVYELVVNNCDIGTDEHMMMHQPASLVVSEAQKRNATES